MAQKETTIKVDPYIDSIPAAAIVKEAKAFDASITATVNGKSADVKSLFQFNNLDLSKGNVITFTAEGNQAQQAVEHLVSVTDSLHSPY